MCIGPLRDPNSINPQTRVIPSFARFLKIIPPSRFHLGIIFPLIVIIILYVVSEKSILGYKIKLSSHPRVASYSGIDIHRIMTITFLVGGGIAGLAGMIEVLGVHHLLIPGFSQNFGFTGIIIAILAKNNFLAEIPVALLFSALLVGGESMQRGAQVPFGIIFIIQALIVLSILMLEKIWE
jgi:simple sugar transport system permease protein